MVYILWKYVEIKPICQLVDIDNVKTQPAKILSYTATRIFPVNNRCDKTFLKISKCFL